MFASRARFVVAAATLLLAIVGLGIGGCGAGSKSGGGSAGTGPVKDATKSSGGGGATNPAGGGAGKSSPKYHVAAARKPAADTKPRYVIITNGFSPFWDAAKVGMENAGKDLGVRVDMMVNDASDQGQIDKLRQIANLQDVVGVGISVTQAMALGVADEMRNLQKKGVHVITIDSDVSRERLADARFAFVGTDNRAGGIELGVTANGIRTAGGKYVTFVGIESSQNAMERIGGFKQGAGESFTALDSMGDDVDPSRARENVRNAIKNHPDLNTLVGIWSYNAPAIVDVVRELNRRKDFTIVTFDAEPTAVDEMAKGSIDAMVVQNPYEMGYQGIRTLKALVEGEEATIQEMYPKLAEPDGNLYDTGLKVVVPDEGSPLSAEMFGPKTQFMKLGEFREWLAKYNLKGS